MMVAFIQDIAIKIMLEQLALKNGYMMGFVMKETMLKNVILMKMIVVLESRVYRSIVLTADAKMKVIAIMKELNL